jgi:replicative DNA helicase
MDPPSPAGLRRVAKPETHGAPTTNGHHLGNPIRNTTETNEEVRDVDVLLELSIRRLVTGACVLDVPTRVESVWGSGHEVLWAQGEAFLMCGPDGVGKTTLIQQLILGLIGVLEPILLGLPLVGGDRRVLYVAADRPVQALRSIRRMVTEENRDLLAEHLQVWKGPLPFDLARNPEGLSALAHRAGCGIVILDSLKDVASELSKEEVGLAVSKAFQSACAEGVDVCALHHQRKAQRGALTPRTLADVYGSRWITSGTGSVVMLWGDPGDSIVQLSHLKQPDETVGPLTVLHDHAIGRSTAIDQVDAYSVVMATADGVTAAGVAKAVYGTSGRNNVERARRSLERLVSEERIARPDEVARGRGHSARYFPK